MSKDKPVASEATEEVANAAPVVEQPKAIIVPAFKKPDVNKIIEERRKAIADGKTIKK